MEFREKIGSEYNFPPEYSVYVGEQNPYGLCSLPGSARLEDAIPNNLFQKLTLSN